ncbi:MAG: radical SAM family heme chaperone HemW [Hahellaceae bacterium]|nr:radical SAM family heme chaperone HemW [Hahellaceae bacterium]
MSTIRSVPPLSLYVHFPWCERKCPYCDFNSHQPGKTVDENAYIDALLADLSSEGVRLDAAGGSRPIQSIFMGGGTPSLFSGPSIQRLMDGIRHQLTLVEDCEITLEANPGTTDSARFKGFHAAGINRLSLGVQSLTPRHLSTLGRIHSRDQALRAVEEARAAGFDNINLDMMHGLPDQTLDESEADLAAAIALKPEHLSWYQLTIEPNTAFHRQPPVLPEDETLWEIQRQGQQQLAAAGFRQYEVSAYTTPGRESRHNLNYWQFGDYLAIGAGAHGKLTDPATGAILRYWKTRQPDHYLRRIGNYVADQATIDASELPFEFMMNALRLVSGVPASLFEQRTGQSLETLNPALQKLRSQGLLMTDETRLACTPEGFDFLNEVLGRFLGE